MKIKKLGIRAKGFTLIEVIIVILILGVLAGVAIPSYNIIKENAGIKICFSDRRTLQRHYLSELTVNSADESPAGFDSFVQDNYGGPVFCPINKTSKYYWSMESSSVECPFHGKKVYNIVLDSKVINNTVSEIYSSFNDFVKVWMANEKTLPATNYTNGSLSWSSASYTGTDKTNLFGAKFWNDYFQFANVANFNAANKQISDFKIFFKHDASGNITSDLAGVYLQLGAARSIYFSNGTKIENKHYSSYIDAISRELKPPP